MVALLGMTSLLFFFLLVKSSTAEEFELLMPNVQPPRNDTHLCYELDIKDTLYITEFKPKASMLVSHHVILYECSESNGFGKPWDCSGFPGAMTGFDAAPVCKTPGNNLYSWGMDAPELKLPDDVAVKVGGDTGIQSLVVQIHYNDVTRFHPPMNGRDNSGVVLTATTTPQKRTAGVLRLSSAGDLPAHSTTYMEAACQFRESLTLYPFAFRSHTHALGVITSGYRVRDGHWAEIGRANPQGYQMFYPVNTPSVTITTGDILAIRCTMVNAEDRDIHFGPTANDEMCNVYIMYYVEDDQLVKDFLCFTPGPPSWKWRDVEGIHLENAPQ